MKPVVKKLVIFFLAALIFFAALLSLLPASSALALIAIPEPLHIDDVRGSIWSGSAQHLRWAQRDFGSVTWQVQPSALLRGALSAVVVVQGDISGAVTIERSVSAWTLQNLDASASATLLAPVLASPGLHPQGRLTLHINEAHLSGDQLKSLSGDVVWSEAAVSGFASAALGEIRATFQRQEDGRLHGEVSDAGGPLAVHGAVIADAHGYQASIHLSARDVRIAPALVWLGQVQADGSRLLLLQGTSP